MSELTPYTPERPLIWSDSVLDLCDHLLEAAQPIYIIGGAVRDAYLHRSIYDLDLATSRDAIGLAKFIANMYDGDVFVMDRERDVARVFIDLPQMMVEDRLVIDVARFRGDSLLADLQDRDFTINAMAVDIKSTSQLIDPLQGAADLGAKLLRRCSDHAIADDPVRALRGIRQSVQFGLRIEPQTLADIRMVGESVLDTSPERLRDELIKLLSLQRPTAALRVADKLGLLGLLIPEIMPLRDLELPPPYALDAWNHTITAVEKLAHLMMVISPRRTDTTASTFDYGMVVVALDKFRPQLQAHLAYHWPNERPHEALLVLTGLLYITGKAEQLESAEEISAKLAENRAIELRLSSDEKQRIGRVIRAVPKVIALDEKPDDLELHRFWYGVGIAGVDACLLALVDYLAMMGNEIDQDAWLRLLEKVQKMLEAYFLHYDEVVAPSTFVDGNELMSALNLSPGPHIKTLLDHIREGQVVKSITDADSAIAAAREYLESQAAP